MARHLLANAYKEEFIRRCLSLKPDGPLAQTLNKFQILGLVSIKG
jgi:hypothetical protein